MNKSLLPPNAVELERNIEQATARVGAVPIGIKALWDVESCPLSLLPWLAWALSVDEWDSDWPEDIKRAVIAQSVEIHRHKGTVGSIKKFLQVAGYGDATLVEGTGSGNYDGNITHNGINDYGDPTGWAKYKIIMKDAIPVSRIDALRSALNKIAPARCHLVQITYTAGHAYDAEFTYNGTYNYGAG